MVPFLRCHDTVLNGASHVACAGSFVGGNRAALLGGRAGGGGGGGEGEGKGPWTE